ncbi:MAG TPA: hypothetical protein V6D21_03330, partial [Candidatus Obscuribacterales bacterium]
GDKRNGGFIKKVQLPKDKTLAAFRIEEEDWERFKSLCMKAGVSATYAITAFVRHSIKNGELEPQISLQKNDEILRKKREMLLIRLSLYLDEIERVKVEATKEIEELRRVL